MAALSPKVTPRASRSWTWLAFVAVMAPLVVVLAVGLSRDPRTIPSPLIGHPAPSFALPLFAGGTVTSGTYRGQVVVLNFWASWCAPACYQEAPELQRAWDTLRGRGLSVVGINIQDREPAARQFIQAYGLTFPNGQDRTGRISIDYGVYGVPETFILDPNGRLVYKHVGAITAQIIQERVDPLLRGTQTP